MGRRQNQSVIYYDNSKYGMDVLHQMARAYLVKGGTRRWPVVVFYNILNLAGINTHILFKGMHQQQESMEIIPAATCRGAEGRIHRGERSRAAVGTRWAAAEATRAAN